MRYTWSVTSHLLDLCNRTCGKWHFSSEQTYLDLCGWWGWICEDRGLLFSGQRAGWRSKSFYFLLKIDVPGYNYCTSLNCVRIVCEVEELLFSPVCQVDSIWIIIRSKRPAVFYPLWANLTSDPWGGSSRQPSARYSTITFLTAFHISDGWSVCRQAAWPDATDVANRPPGTYTMPPGPGWAPWTCLGNAGKFHKTLLAWESTVASNRIYAHSHIHALVVSAFLSIRIYERARDRSKSWVVFS